MHLVDDVVRSRLPLHIYDCVNEVISAATGRNGCFAVPTSGPRTTAFGILYPALVRPTLVDTQHTNPPILSLRYPRTLQAVIRACEIGSIAS
jgi:hypothetical protein